MLEDEIDVLKKKYGVNEFFYPKISMDIDLPGGLKKEVTSIKEALENNGYDSTTEGIYEIMSLKKHMLDDYSEPDHSSRIDQYKRLILSKEAVGSIVPIEYFIVCGVTGFVLYGLGKFVGSFSEESGKIWAQRLFKEKKTKKQLSKKFDLTQDEYYLLAEQAIIILADKKLSKKLHSTLKKKSSDRN